MFSIEIQMAGHVLLVQDPVESASGYSKCSVKRAHYVSELLLAVLGVATQVCQRKQAVP